MSLSFRMKGILERDKTNKIEFHCGESYPIFGSVRVAAVNLILSFTEIDNPGI